MAWNVTGCFMATGVAIATVWVTAAGIAHRFAVRIAIAPPRLHAELRAYYAWRFWHNLALMLTYGACVGLFGWGWAVKQVCTPTDAAPGYFWPGAELLVLTPFFLMLFGSWWWFHAVDAAVHHTVAPAGDERPMVGRLQYVILHFRPYVLQMLLPLGILIFMLGVDRQYPELLKDGTAGAGMLAVIVAAFLAFPLMLRPLLGLKPMRPGPRRDQLESVSRSIRLRYRDLMVWNTHGGISNAMVIGLVPATRYLIFTDRLLEDLSEEQLLAVFGHEAGHVKHGHLAFYGCFLLLSVFAFSAAWAPCVEWLDRHAGGWASVNRVWLEGGQLMAMLAYIFVVFGYLSRRCERQADVFGCRVASRAEGRLTPEGVATFVSALRTVTRTDAGDGPGTRSRRRGPLRGMLAWLGAWQHSTVERRAAFLGRLAQQPELDRRFQRRLAWVKWGVILTLAGTVAVLGFVFGWDVLLQSV